MDQQIKKLLEIEHDKDNAIEQQAKRFKFTHQGLLDSIALSIETIAQSTQSIGESHAEFLKVNKILTSYLLEIEKKNKEKNKQAQISISSTQDRN